MKNQKTKEPAIKTTATFTFHAVGIAPGNRAFTFNIEAKNEEEARKALAADLGKVINDLAMDVI